jgi:hypothetical protein
MKRPSLSGVTLASAAWFSLFAAGVALRYVTLFPVTKFQADADCIQTGLCALRILTGDFRVFYNGVRIGAIESYLHALAFMILGPTRQAMGYAPWLASSLGMLCTYLFVRRLAGEKAAVWGLFSIALPAPAFLYWTVQPNGYSVTLALAAATLWLGAWVADEPERRALWLAFGLVVGLSWWASLQTLSVSLPVIAWLVLRKAPFGLAAGRARLAHFSQIAVLAAAGFLVGAAPWIAYNVRYPFASFTGTNSVARPALGSALVADNVRFVTTDSLPELFVSTDPEGGPNPPGPLARALRYPAAAVYCLALGWFFARGDRDSPAGPKQRRALAVLLIGATVAINVFSAAGSTRGLNVRYVLPIYLLVPLALGLFLVRVAERKRLWGPALAAALGALLITFSASVYFWPTTVMRQRLHAAASGECQVLTLLRHEGVELAVGDYWLVYPLNFASREWIRAVPCDTNADLYGYGAALRQVPERFALIAYSIDEVKAEAQRAGVTGEITYFQPSYAVLVGDSPPAEPTPGEFLARLCRKP